MDFELPSYKALEYLTMEAVGSKGSVKFARVPKPNKAFSEKHAFIDWVNFTFKKSALPIPGVDGVSPDDEDYIISLSAMLTAAIGYGVTGKRESGMNFYTSAYDLGVNGLGMICIGGQEDSVLVTIKGQGLMVATPGWESRLYRMISNIDGAKLTRVDLACDNFNSNVGLDDYLSMYHAGLFTLAQRAPNIEQAGNWVNPNGKGRTLYIGNRKSGKLLRVYEKGLQLANGFHERFPNWLRVELELKAVDRVVPLECLLCPGQYLAGAYPALANLHAVQKKVETEKRVVKSTALKSMAVVNHQFGKHIWTQIQIHGVERAIELMTKGKEMLPKSLDFYAINDLQEKDFLHFNNVDEVILCK